MATGADYCRLADVLSRLYAGQGIAPGDPAPMDATRDALLASLINKTSRDFDHEVAGPNFQSLFAPKFDVRTFSGKGSQELEIDPVLVLAKVEVNSTPGRTPTWVDYSVELDGYHMGLLPAGVGYPKHSIFRQASFYEDPFPLGNVRLSGIWGICLVDTLATPPLNPWQGVNPQLYVPAEGGWWVTPDDVVDAVAGWCVYKFEHAKSAYSQHPGPIAAAGATAYPSEIPEDIMRVIRRYQTEDANHPKLALVGNDHDLPTETGYRWAGWLTR